jgi:cytochrome c oxidase subunit 2
VSDPAAHPLGYLAGAAGPTAWPTQTLARGFTGISIAVTLIILALVVLAIVRGRRAVREDGDGVARSGSGLSWILWGVGLSLPVLMAMAIWSFAVTRAVAQPPARTGLTIEVTAKRWWWDMRYLADSPAGVFTTANEMVIPQGVPVTIRLTSGDVIHDFWVPKLGPKMDVIPGKWNATWLQADVPGTYWGACAEFCGMEHAKMRFRVRVLTPADYQRWRTGELEPAVAGAGAGHALFLMRCASCHAVRGGEAGGIFGPDLTHMASRTTIGAGLLPNTADGRDRWLADTQGVKPGAEMPTIPMTVPERHALVAYLGSLR